MPYVAMTKTFEAIEATSGRLKIINTLSNLFRSILALTPDDLAKCVYLCLNNVRRGGLLATLLQYCMHNKDVCLRSV